MDKQSHKSIKKNGHFNSDILDQHPFIVWVMEHGEKILYTLLGAFLILLFSYMWFSESSSREVSDFRSANEEFQAFQKLSDYTNDLSSQNEALVKLTQILQQHPSLQAKYEGLIAQALIDRNEVVQALPFAESTFRRVGKDNLPLYIDYSEITLLIGQNHYEEAIKKSITLKEKMNKLLASDRSSESQLVGQNLKESFGEYLYAFNLLRIAFLQKHAGTAEQEIQSWKEWKDYMGPIGMLQLGSSFNTKAFFATAQLFNEGNLSLNYYIDERLQTLALQEKK